MVFGFECEITKIFLCFGRGPVFAVFSGFLLIGWGLYMSGRTVCFIESRNLGVSLTANTFTETLRIFD